MPLCCLVSPLVPLHACLPTCLTARWAKEKMCFQLSWLLSGVCAGVICRCCMFCCLLNNGPRRQLRQHELQFRRPLKCLIACLPVFLELLGIRGQCQCKDYQSSLGNYVCLKRCIGLSYMICYWRIVQHATQTNIWSTFNMCRALSRDPTSVGEVCSLFPIVLVNVLHEHEIPDHPCTE